MFNKLLIIFFIAFFSTVSMAQSITVLDSTYTVYNYSATPIDELYDYSYTQVIYRQTDIQGSGTITSLKYYFGGTSLSNSDSVLVYLGNTAWDEFNYTIGRELVPVARMDSVFKGKMTYGALPGSVTITLTKPFVYNSDSNLVVAVCEKKPGNNAVVNGLWFIGYDGASTGTHLIRNRSSFVDLNPMDPAYVEQHINQYLGGSGGVARITLEGLSPFPCQSPRNVYIDNIKHNLANVIWSSPLTTIPSFYDVYCSNNRNKPFRPTIPTTTVNALDTQVVITNLLADTMYYVWVRSRCGNTDTSVWTITDSFHTTCPPNIVVNGTELFNDNFAPHCWDFAVGLLGNPTQFTPMDTTYSQSNTAHFWKRKEFGNQTGSGNYSAFRIMNSSSLQDWLITPSFDLGTSTNKSLEFDLALTKNGNSQQGTLASDDKFIVVISTDNGFTWSSTNTLQTWNSSTPIPASGTHVTIPLNAYNSIVRIGFYVESTIDNGVAARTNIFVDNVKISAVLPINLLEFTGRPQDNQNLLQWRTATEQNNRGFELQRSAKGVEFSSITFVPTKSAVGGNSTAVLNYHYNDTKPLSSNNYYRLKQIDNDGKATFSNVVLIKGNPGNELVQSAIYPNPVSTTLNVAINAPGPQKVTVMITDLAGRTVQQQTMELQAGNNTATLSVATLQSGVYFVKTVCSPASGGGCSSTAKFVKQ